MGAFQKNSDTLIKEPKMGESEILNTVVFLQSGLMRSTPLSNKEAWRTHTDEMPILGADTERGWERLGLCYQIVGGIRRGRSSDQEIVQGHEWWDTRARWRQTSGRKLNASCPRQGKSKVPTLRCELTVSYAGKGESWYSQPRQRTHGGSSQLQSSGETRDPPHDELCLSAQGPSGSRTSWTRITWVLSVCARWHFLLFATLAMLWESDLSGLCPWVPPSPTSGSVMGSPGTADGEGPPDLPVVIEPRRVPRTTGEDRRSSPHLQSGPEASAFCALWVAAARPRNLSAGQDRHHWDYPSISAQRQSKGVHCTDKVPWQSAALSWQVVGGLLPFRVVVVFFFLFYCGLPWWLSGEESTCQGRRHGPIPGSWICPGGGNGNPLHYSCLEHPMDRGAWQATVQGVAKSQTRPQWLSTHTYIDLFSSATAP